jgi:hypothetical protein
VVFVVVVVVEAAVVAPAVAVVVDAMVVAERWRSTFHLCEVTLLLTHRLSGV